MAASFTLESSGIQVSDLRRNLAPAALYEEAIRQGDIIAETGALVVSSGEKTGRSPDDRRIVQNQKSTGDVWWGKVNIEMSEEGFKKNRDRAIGFLNREKRLYVFDGFAGWSPRFRRKVRIVCKRPYHALFMHNMLVRPSANELRDFGQPDYTVYNAGTFPADPEVEGVSSRTSVDLDFNSGEVVILGTEYAGEMKKGIFTIMNFIMPDEGVFPMHCSANEGEAGDVSLFFGLSGTGKTTLSADPRRKLIGDDEHCWSEEGIFNIEGGCYAKCIRLTKEKEPDIWNALSFGSVLENVTCDPVTRRIDYDDDSVTENTRGAYPIEHIRNAKVPCEGAVPSHIIFLTCDAFGVLPPVSRLNDAQARYHFMSGYTAKVAGTEQGVDKPKASFSACFGAPFMVRHPNVYAELLAKKINEHQTQVWLINSGWSGGPYGEGERIRLEHTRAIIDAIHGGSLAKAEYRRDPVFGLEMPKTCPKVPSEILNPRNAWRHPEAYDKKARDLACLFRDNFETFAAGCPSEVVDAGPR